MRLGAGSVTAGLGSKRFSTYDVTVVPNDGSRERTPSFSIKTLLGTRNTFLIGSAPYLGLVNGLELLPPAFLNHFNGTSIHHFPISASAFGFEAFVPKYRQTPQDKKEKNPMRLMSTIWHPLST
ncbi:hypothetical protein TNIN_145691 [Trichonephila inaurata madagascariensis]|uniref:Uncharacterized protein n=1 Tax=Trichonephila inaurata madagascariensis TaxID=2747483 RepID=A0A8X6WL61_9ARAC|nr:hypothetical protein TNIN_145691 [Trichonephila inaurata madagascariensis]